MYAQKVYRGFESHPLRHSIIIMSLLIAGSCATKPCEPRQVRKEATAVGPFVCRRGAWLSSFFNAMSYLVLARKWRPQTFEDVIGQVHVTRTLQNAISQDRLAHALIFSGPRGVGKTSVARILAKAINCESGPGPIPCNQCGICREITSGASVDVQEIDGASNRGIDEVRQLRENIRFRPTRCRFRVYIIDEVHMLTKEAFNALLKTLEEPPAHVYFMFATTEPQKIPSTIHSRCQHYEFKRLSTTQIADHLQKIVTAEGLTLDRQALLLLAREAKGGVRDSLSLLDQVTAYGAVTVQEVCEALGVVGTEVLKELALALLEGNLPVALKIVDQVYGFGIDIQTLALDLLSFMRDLSILKALGVEEAKGLVDFSPEEMQELSGKIENISSHRLHLSMEILLSGQNTVQKSSTPRLALEMLLIKVASTGEVVSIDRLCQGVNELLNSIRTSSSNPAPRDNSAFHGVETMPPSASFPSSTAVKVESGDRKPSSKKAGNGTDLDRWGEFINFVRASRPALASALKSCKTCEITHGKLCLKCALGMNYEVLTDKVNMGRLRDLLREFFSRDIDITIQADGSSQRRSERPASSSSRREQLVQEPLVQEALRVFQARIAEVKVRG